MMIRFEDWGIKKGACVFFCLWIRLSVEIANWDGNAAGCVRGWSMDNEVYFHKVLTQSEPVE